MLPGEDGPKLLDRWLNGERLRRRERKTLELFLAWRSAAELEHVCSLQRGIDPIAEERQQALREMESKVKEEPWK